MKGSLDKNLKYQLKQMIIEESDKDMDPEDIKDNDALFGEESVLGLDSLDALQISMAIYKRYGVKITDPKEVRRVFTSINAVADTVQPT